MKVCSLAVSYTVPVNCMILGHGPQRDWITRVEEIVWDESPWGSFEQFPIRSLDHQKICSIQLWSDTHTIWQWGKPSTHSLTQNWMPNHSWQWIRSSTWRFETGSWRIRFIGYLFLNRNRFTSNIQATWWDHIHTYIIGHYNSSVRITS